MEFCSGGSCGDLMKPGLIPEEYITIIIRELLMGLEYLHSDKKLHRDIKGDISFTHYFFSLLTIACPAANVLLAANGQVKLADFGVSGQLSATMTKKNTFVGTPFWMAPEVIKQSGYDHKADIWSLGITALELAKGEPPYSDIHPMKVLFLIPKNPPPTLTGDFSRPFKDFVELCLKRDPRERPTASELLKHPFVRRAKRTTYLTELIERHERWHAVNGGRDSEDDEEEQSGDDNYTPEQQDLWDFGTVRPAGGRGAGLKAMNESDTNSRTKRASSHIMPEQDEDQDRAIYRESTSRDSFEQAAEDTVKPRNGSPQRRAPMVSLSTLESPNAAAKVPLPPSPMKSPAKHVNHQDSLGRLKRPGKVAQQASPSSIDYDRALQRSLADDMKILNLGTNEFSPHPTDNASRSQKFDKGTTEPKKLLGPFSLPEIPPFQGQAKSRPLQPLPSQSTPSPKLPKPSVPQQPLPSLTSNGLFSTPPFPNPASPQVGLMAGSRNTKDPMPANLTKQQPPESAPVTALHSVIVPALEATLQRRSYNLKQQLRHETKADSDRLLESVQKQQYAHEKIKKLVIKAAGVFSEIEKWDNVAPVDMGGGVGVFLEGFLEEILVRVEAEDEVVTANTTNR